MSQRAEELMMALVAVDHQLKALEAQKVAVRLALQDLMREAGQDKLMVQGIGTASMVAGAKRTSYSSSKCDDLMAILLRDALYDYADLLVNARSETVGAPYLVFKSDKKRGDNE
jgi:isochorismate hydrolase